MADFGKDVAAFAKRAGMSTEKAIKGTAISLFGAVIQSTPVDTGRARANWMIAGATPAGGTSTSTDSSGSSTINEMTAFVAGSKLTEFTLANNLPYASVLEFGGYPGDGPKTAGGFSTQAPQGMVRVNAARFEALLEKEAAKARNS
jgi:hypothetical protein